MAFESERFLYEYDVGDLWQHDIRVERIGPVEPTRTYPLCIGGRRACPPEDCGGPWAFMELEQQYSIVHIVERLEEIVEDEEEALECSRDELDTFRVWLRKERFDRREVNRRLKQYALGDRDWQQALRELGGHGHEHESPGRH